MTKTLDNLETIKAKDLHTDRKEIQKALKELHNPGALAVLYVHFASAYKSIAALAKDKSTKEAMTKEAHYYLKKANKWFKEHEETKQRFPNFYNYYA